MRVHLRSLAMSTIVLLLTSAWPAAAQTTYAAITGTVTDASGGVIKGAAVVATNVETSVVTRTTTNDAGVYTVGQLREGPYMLSITAPGLREFLVTDIVLVTRDVRRIDATLEVGALEAAVKVTGGAAAIELDTARISDVRTAEQLRTLPLNDPGIYSFLAVTPMLAQRSGSYTMAGSRYNQSQFSLDGTSMSDGVGETPIGPLANYIESFKEVKIDIASNSAESASLGQVTIISKSGTNQFHGAVFDYYQSPMFRATNPFSNRRPAGVTPLPGSGARRPGGDSAALRRTRPDVLVRLGRDGQRQLGVGRSQPDGSDRGVASRRLLGARTPDSQSVHRRGLRRRPHPGRRHSTRSRSRSRSGSIRCRTPATPPCSRRTTTARPSAPSAVKAVLRDGARRPQLRHQRSHLRRASRCIRRPIRCGKATCRHSACASSFARTRRLTFRTRASSVRARQRVPRRSRLQQQSDQRSAARASRWCESLGLSGLAPGLPDIGGVLKVNFPGSGLTGLSQIDYSNPGFLNRINQVNNHTTWLRGTHSLKFGTEIRRVDWEEMAAPANLFGSVDFTGRFTAVPGIAASGHPYADFLFGAPNTASRAFPPVPGAPAAMDLRLLRAGRLEADAQPDAEPRPALRRCIPAGSSATTGWRSSTSPAARSSSPDGRPRRRFAAHAGGLRRRRHGQQPRAAVAHAGANRSQQFRAAPRPRLPPVRRQRDGHPRRLRPLLRHDADRSPGEPARRSSSRRPRSRIRRRRASCCRRCFQQLVRAGPSTIALPLAVNPDISMPYSHQWNVTVEHERWGTGFRASYVAHARP